MLTPIGEVFVRRAEGIEAELQRTLDEVEQLKGTDFGSVTVGMSTAGHVGLLPKLIVPFRRRYPKTRLKIIEGLFPSLETRVRDGIIDLYVGPVPKSFVDGSLIIERFFDNRRIIIARRGHPLRSATTITQLVGAAWVSTPVVIDIENEVNSIFLNAGLLLPHIAVEAQSGLSIIAVVASSDLLAPLPQQWKAFIEQTPFIEEIKLQEVTYTPGICSVRRAGLPLTPAAEYLHNLVRRAAINHARLLPD